MKLKKCYFREHRCFKASQKMPYGKPQGMVIHSTGANNKTLKRYVQPTDRNINKNAILTDLGVNKFGNHWNTSSLDKCPHAFIGVNDKGEVETYQVLKFKRCCWGCGKGSKGSYNYNPAYLQVEICEDDLKDEEYFNLAFKEAIEFSAKMCKKFGFSVDNIVSHAEAHAKGYASNHADCDHWLKKFGKDMDWFRAEVKKLLKKQKKAGK